MGLIDVFYPKICVGCGSEGEYICLECQKRLGVPESICSMCCKPSLDGWSHPRCRKRSGMERLLVGLPYRGMVQDCLKKVKYKSAWGIIEFLYRLCEFPATEGVIASVPMWREKEQGRGFNQAELIARLLAKNYKDLPAVPTAQLLQAGPIFVRLERVRETRPMFGLKRKARIENVKGAFKLVNQYTNVPINQRVILVDDVWTTGATMLECARVLKRAGAAEVWGVALAR